MEENIYLVHSIMNFLSKDIKESSSSQESLNQANNNLEDSIDRIFFFYLEIFVLFKIINYSLPIFHADIIQPKKVTFIFFYADTKNKIALKPNHPWLAIEFCKSPK